MKSHLYPHPIAKISPKEPFESGTKGLPWPDSSKISPNNESDITGSIKDQPLERENSYFGICEEVIFIFNK